MGKRKKVMMLPNPTVRPTSPLNPAGIICLLLFLLYLLPFLVLRQNAHFPVNDNLDWLSGWVILAQSGQAFSLTGEVAQIMHGVPRASLPSGFNVITWLYLLLPPFDAYLLNFVIVHATAFAGARLFFGAWAARQNLAANSFVVWGAALSFGLLPFYTVYGLSIAGQPLLAYAFFNIYHGQKLPQSFLIIIIFTLYSSLPLAGVFIVLALALIALFDFWRQKTPRKNFLLAIFVLAASYCLTEIWLVHSTLFPEGVSSRTEIDRLALGQNRGIRDVWQLICENFANGQYHAVSLHYYILTIAAPAAVLVGLWRKDPLLPALLLLLAAAFLLSAAYGIRYHTLFLKIAAKNEFFNSFQIQRFHWFHPFLWYAVFALALAVIARLKFIGKLLALSLLVLQLAVLFANNIEYNLYLTEKEIITKDCQVMPDAWLYENITYGQFFSTNLFRKADNYINRPKEDYRILNIGIYPAAAQYYGFYTLDGRLNIYPLAYKHAFRKIIAKELAKNSFWQNYFDNWGITCYVLPAELELLQVRKSYQLKLNNLELNTQQIKNLGGEYIFSAAEITNHQKNNLRFLTKITDEASPWEIYLYEVDLADTP